MERDLFVDAHVVACEDADKDAGEEMDLCTVTEMAMAEPLTWDDEDVAAPERQGFLPLQEPDAHFPDACNQFARCHFACCSLRKLLPKQ